MKKKDPDIATFQRVKDELFIADYLIFCQPEPSTRNEAQGTKHPEPSTWNQAPETKHLEQSTQNQASGTSMTQNTL